MVNLLDVASVVRFANHLDKPFIIDARMGGSFMIHAVQVQLDLGLGLVDPNTGQPVLTTVWAYQLMDYAGATVGTPHMMGSDGMLNPTFLTESGVPIQVTWMNMLPTTGHILPVDPTIANMCMSDGCTMTLDPNLIPIVTHLHGGHVASIYDGFPTSTITQMGATGSTGMNMNMSSSVTYTYDNSQEASMLWYHDHSLGFTRLNVFAGLVGTYVIEDANRKALIAAGILPDTLSDLDRVLTIADKSFTADGQLYFPSQAGDPLPGTTDTVQSVLPPNYTGPAITAVPEYYGDVITVNGTAWPHAHVAAGNQLYDIVNGSDSRFYVLRLDNPHVKVQIIGTDGGLLHHAITVINGDGVDDPGEQIVLAPGDRLQLMFDFSNLAPGEKVHLLNVGPAFEPFKGFAADGSLDIAVAATTADSVGELMEFRVTNATPWHSTITDDTILNPNDVPMDIPADVVTRKLGIFEVADQFSRIMPRVGTAEHVQDANGNDAFGDLGWDAPVTEIVQLGATEIWEFCNTTADAHPIHLHLGEYQVLGRYHISTTDVNGDGVELNGEAIYNNDLGDLVDTDPFTDGIQNLYAEDMGSQDTVWLAPGDALKVVMKFDRPGDFVWHCHILSHEDHDMMRPIKVVGFAGDLVGAIGEDSLSAALGLLELGKADGAMQGFVAGTFTGTEGLGGLTINAKGEWSYSVNGEAQKLGAGEIATDIVTITELDGTTHEIRIAVRGANDAPVVAQALANLTSDEDAAFTFAIPAGSFTDIDRTDTLTYAAHLLGGDILPTWLAFDANTGAFSGTPPTNWSGSLNVEVTATDNHGASAASAFTFTINPVNDAPVAALALANQATLEDTAISFSLPANAFTDVDAGDSLTYQAALANGVALPSWLVFDAATQTFSGTPPLNWNGSLSIKVTATDTGGLSASSTFDFAVTPVNDAPVVSAPVTLTDTQNGRITITSAQLLANATDVDSTQLKVIGLTASSGILIDNKDGTWDYTPGVNTTAPATFTYQVSDGQASTAGSASMTFTAGFAYTVFTGTAAANTFRGTVGHDYVDALAGADDLQGGIGNDVFIGGLGNDQAQGGAGNDWFIATIGDGNDNYQGDAGIDTYDLSRTNAAATVNLATGASSSIETGTDRLNQIENVIGSSSGDTITGDGLANRIEGRAGNDIINGGAGNDIIVGGAGDDQLTGGLGNDTFVFAYDNPAYLYDYNFGKDTITDFVVGATAAVAHDVLDLRGLGFISFADVLTHTDAGPNAVIHAGANTITLNGVAVTTLHAWDVIV